MKIFLVSIVLFVSTHTCIIFLDSGFLTEFDLQKEMNPFSVFDSFEYVLLTLLFIAFFAHILHYR